MQMYEKMMMPCPMTADVVAFECSCPTLVLLRWDVVMPSLDLIVEVVLDDNANHAKYDLDVDVASLLVELDDSLIDLVDAPALLMEHVLL